MRNIENWLSREELQSIYSSSYWNNAEEEKKKEWWIEEGGYEKCLNYLKSSKLLYEYEESEKFINNFLGDALRVVDLAAGIGWTSSLISKLPKVAEVHAVEISKHRLDSLFQHSVKMLSGKDEKIFRYLGSSYDLHFKDKSMDIIYVLKENGRIILVGEHYIGAKKIIRRFLSMLIKIRKVASFHEMFPPDHVLGDHYYRRSDYYSMFGAMGFDVKHQLLENESAIYIADKQRS